MKRENLLVLTSLLLTQTTPLLAMLNPENDINQTVREHQPNFKASHTEIASAALENGQTNIVVHNYGLAFEDEQIAVQNNQAADSNSYQAQKESEQLLKEEGNTQELNDVKKEISNIVRKINLIQEDTLETSSTTKLAFLAHATGEENHPNSEGKLLAAVEQVIQEDEYNNLTEFNNKVYALLRLEENPIFRYIINEKPVFDYLKRETIIKKYEMGRSNILLFWLICNKVKNRVSVINKCAAEIHTLKDSKDNNILHIASLYRDTETLECIFEGDIRKSIPKDLYPKFINHRNEDGTNPLGMFFINPSNLKTREFKDVLELFIYRREFKVNSYLNNKKGMDYNSDYFFKDIGGYNCLHFACIDKNLELLNILKRRNELWSIEKVPPEYFVNFTYPSLNPRNHMTSPKLLIDPSNGKNHDPKILEMQEILFPLQKEQLKNEMEDESGDSDDEESYAHQYKKVLMNFSKLIGKAQQHKVEASPINKNAKHQEYINYLNNIEIDDNKKLVTEEFKKEAEGFHANIIIPHFHGVPFMQGQYKNYQRREVAKKLFDINDKKIKKWLGEEEKETEIEERDNILFGIHSRTSTASNGIDNIYDLLNADEQILRDLDKTDKKLNEHLSTCYRDNRGNFLGSLEQYLFYFSQNYSPFWSKINNPDEIIIKYRFPLVSTSKAPNHPVKFGFGVNVESTNRGESPLFPHYTQNGLPKHRLAGLLYISFHTLAELHEMQKSHQIADVTQLSKSGQISGQGEIRVLPQIEVTFFGGIKGNHIVAIIPLFYDNKNRKSKSFDKEYHSAIWGLKEDLTDWREKGSFVDTKYHDNFKEYFKLTSPTRMTSAYIKLALKISSAIASLQNKHLAYVSPENHIKLYSTDSNSFSKVQDDIKNTLSGGFGTPEDKKKIAPDKLIQETNAMRFSKLVKKPIDFSKEIELDATQSKTTLVISENGKEFYEQLISGYDNACVLYCLGFKNHREALDLIEENNNPEIRQLVIPEMRADIAQNGIISKQDEYKKLNLKITNTQIKLNNKINELKEFISKAPEPENLNKEIEEYNTLYEYNKRAEVDLIDYLSSVDVFVQFMRDTVQKGKMLSYLPVQGATSIIDLLAKLKMKNLCIYGKNLENKLVILHQHIWDKEKPFFNLIHTQYQDENGQRICGGVPGTLLKNSWNHFNLLVDVNKK